MTAAAPRPATMHESSVNWNAIYQQAAPSVSLATMLAGSAENGTGTAYVAAVPWPSSSGQSGDVPTVVTAWHVPCSPSLLYDTTTVRAFGGSIADVGVSSSTTQGLCQSSLLGGDPAQDIASFPFADLHAPAQVTPLALAQGPPQVGDKVLVLGHPLGSPGLIETFGIVQAVGVNGIESADRAAPQRTLHGIVVIAGDIYPGDSGSPVLNAQGQVAGTVVAGGPVGSGSSQRIGYVVPWQSSFAPQGFVQKDGLIDPQLGCPRGSAGFWCRFGF